LLDVHVHLNPRDNECKAKYPVDQRRELHQYIDISKDEPDPKCLTGLALSGGVLPLFERQRAMLHVRALHMTQTRTVFSVTPLTR
jgi:hypothetical protein